MWTEEIVAGRPAWRHIASGVVFREVRGGTFRMGLSALLHSPIGGQADALPNRLSDRLRELGERGGDS
jgi:hypothetical protein